MSRASSASVGNEALTSPKRYEAKQTECRSSWLARAFNENQVDQAELRKWISFFVCSQSKETMRLLEAKLGAPCCNVRLWIRVPAAALEIPGACPGVLVKSRPTRPGQGCNEMVGGYPSGGDQNPKRKVPD